MKRERHAIVFLSFLVLSTILKQISMASATANVALSDCEGRWQAVDANTDGMLNATEVAQGKAWVPVVLLNQGAIARTDFMRECGTEGGAVDGAVKTEDRNSTDRQ